eukprot:2575092-Amphidinium_carterae.2
MRAKSLCEIGAIRNHLCVSPLARRLERDVIKSTLCKKFSLCCVCCGAILALRELINCPGCQSTHLTPHTSLLQQAAIKPMRLGSGTEAYIEAADMSWARHAKASLHNTSALQGKTMQARELSSFCTTA